MPSTLKMSWWQIIGTLWILLLPLCSSAKTSELLLHTEMGVQSFKVTTAISQDDQLTGLQGWTSLAADEGMLFIFSDVTQRPFWMKHISIPLDILFIDSSSRVVDIIRHAEPGSETPLVSNSPFLAALEVNSGTVAQMSIDKGDHVYHPLIQARENALPE
jgi:uncharacterized membrane protein (UPF0127 family)